MRFSVFNRQEMLPETDFPHMVFPYSEKMMKVKTRVNAGASAAINNRGSRLLPGTGSKFITGRRIDLSLANTQ